MGTTVNTQRASAISSFGPASKVAVIGASGGIGRAFVERLEADPAVERLFTFRRAPETSPGAKVTQHRLDLEDEASIAEAAARVKSSAGDLDLVIVATGVLHDTGGLRPEKTWRALSGPTMERALRVNTIGPALVAKHFLPLLTTNRKSAFAALSARVGSIADNQLGGWHSYRASKAALNMVIRTLAIELARKNPSALCVGLHPGTVDTGLSKPFQAGVAAERLFSPERSAAHLLTVLDRLTPANSGHLFAWDGSQIPF